MCPSPPLGLALAPLLLLLLLLLQLLLLVLLLLLLRLCAPWLCVTEATKPFVLPAERHTPLRLPCLRGPRFGTHGVLS